MDVIFNIWPTEQHWEIKAAAPDVAKIYVHYVGHGEKEGYNQDIVQASQEQFVYTTEQKLILYSLNYVVIFSSVVNQRLISFK